MSGVFLTAPLTSEYPSVTTTMRFSSPKQPRASAGEERSRLAERRSPIPPTSVRRTRHRSQCRLLCNSRLCRKKTRWSSFLCRTKVSAACFCPASDRDHMLDLIDSVLNPLLNSRSKNWIETTNSAEHSRQQRLERKN